MTNSTLACNMTAFTADQSKRHQDLAQQLKTSIQDVKELSNGFAFRLPAEQTIFLATAEFVTLERLCCPFFNFALELGAESGPAWLKLTGPEGVKSFIKSELGFEG